MPELLTDPWIRFHERVSAWRLTLDRTRETETSLLGFGVREQDPIVLKVIKRHDDEWRAGEILSAYDGRGMARALDWVPGAVLMERLEPATRLVDIAIEDDDEATEILASVISEMRPEQVPDGIPAVERWGLAFDPYLAKSHPRLPASLVAEAHRLFSELATSQNRPRLLHGDLHHDNVLSDRRRGWIGVDPKGILGELEYEVGAALRNPCEHPRLFTDPARIRRRIAMFVDRLDLDAERVAAWAFAQAVLAAVWLIEDGSEGEPLHAWLALADILHA